MPQIKKAQETIRQRDGKMKKSRSTQYQLLSIIIAAILAISLFTGGASILEIDRYMRTSSEDMLNTISDKEAQRINSVLSGMEKSVRVMTSYVLDFYDSEADVTDEKKREEIIADSALMFIDVAKYTERTASYFLRFNPEISDATAGMRYKRVVNDDGSIDFAVHATTALDMSMDYDPSNKEDVDTVGWFFEPYLKREGVWLMPYHKASDDTMLVTFSKPLFYGEQFIGVVGMDFVYSELTDTIDEIKVFDNGLAFLTHEDHIAYHKDAALHEHTPDFSDEYIQTSRELRNGMDIVILAYKGDLARVRQRVELAISAATLLVAAILISVVIIIVKRFFTRPLEKLTESAMKLAAGNYEVETIHSRTKEIELLNNTFVTMAEQLSAHDKYQHRLAYRDALTGLRNATSYKAWADEFANKIGESITDFGIAVLDLNFLKETNDKYGHDIGNRVLVAAARTIAYTFKRSPVFRIGGDEFVVILQGHDFEEREALVEMMHERAEYEKIAFGDNVVPVSIACGVAVYDSALDDDFRSVFNRADARMYENKKIMKSTFSV